MLCGMGIIVMLFRMVSVAMILSVLKRIGLRDKQRTDCQCNKSQPESPSFSQFQSLDFVAAKVARLDVFASLDRHAFGSDGHNFLL
jgi:hypothetical protein